MILLDATYKTTKYALPLFFIVVQTNANFQVCCAIVLQEESTEMITKALKIYKEWNPMVSPKYAFVDFDEREVTSLEIVFERVKVFLCDFHREQSWHRWTSKIENGFSHIFDQVKTRLRCIVHSTTHTDCQSAVKDLMSWECFSQGKLKNWFLKTWLPHIKRWCLAYGPDDLILCNTNNGTERLNEDLKYDELKGLKQSSLSEVLIILVNSFIPKHYKKYIKFNVRYGDGCKRYASDISYFLKNLPKKIVEILLEKMYRAVPKSEINRLDQREFKVNHNEECTGIRKEYEVFLGNESKFCSCSCHDFRRYRMLCKHFLQFLIQT